MESDATEPGAVLLTGEQWSVVRDILESQVLRDGSVVIRSRLDEITLRRTPDMAALAVLLGGER